MATPDDITRVQPMLEASRKILAYTQDHSRDDLDTNELLALAVVRLLEIVGEASKNISEAVKEKYSTVPWKQIAGTRDRLTHGYFDVDLDIIWQIVSSDLPPLIDSLELILLES
jgi:uncharacterized protein with HEPN domain